MHHLKKNARYENDIIFSPFPGRGFVNEDTSVMLDDTIVYGDDYLAFKRLVSNLLFNHGYHEYVDEMGRNHRHVKAGILRMDMPRALEDENSLVGSMYDRVMKTCYGKVCSYGLFGFFGSIADVMENLGVGK